jgi:hypothetical protein
MLRPGSSFFNQQDTASIEWIRESLPLIVEGGASLMTQRAEWLLTSGDRILGFGVFRAGDYRAREIEA